MCLHRFSEFLAAFFLTGHALVKAIPEKAGFMFTPDSRWYLSLGWVLIVVAIGALVGRASTGIVSLLCVSALVPPFMLFALWKKTPPLTVAEVLHNAETRM